MKTVPPWKDSSTVKLVKPLKEGLFIGVEQRARYRALVLIFYSQHIRDWVECGYFYEEKGRICFHKTSFSPFSYVEAQDILSATEEAQILHQILDVE